MFFLAWILAFGQSIKILLQTFFLKELLQSALLTQSFTTYYVQYV